MKIIINRPAVPEQLSREQWALAIREQFGDLSGLATKFSPMAQQYCADNIRKAIADNLPNFARILATYGKQGIAALLTTHITDAIVKMGEDGDVDRHDVRFIAESICQSERFRWLRFPTVIAFFHRLKCGEFDIYGKITPRKILEAFRKYAVEARAQENRIACEIECERKALAQATHDAVAMPWREYAASRGIPDETLHGWVMRQMATE